MDFSRYKNIMQESLQNKKTPQNSLKKNKLNKIYLSTDVIL